MPLCRGSSLSLLCSSVKLQRLIRLEMRHLVCLLLRVPVVENGVQEDGSGDAATAAADTAAPSSRPPVESDTDNGPADTPSSDGEPSDPPAPPPGRHHRRRQGPGSEPGRPDGSPPPPPVTRKPPRAKSQPAISTKDSRRTSSRGEGQQGAELRRTANHVRACTTPPECSGETHTGSHFSLKTLMSCDLLGHMTPVG